MPLQTQPLSSYKCMWQKQAKNGLQDFAVQSAKKKALVIVGKGGITQTSLVPHKHTGHLLPNAIPSPYVTCFFPSPSMEATFIPLLSP